MMADAELTLADFQRYFPYTPTALCIKECARLSALRNHKCSSPLLDVGCGDGLFASIAYKELEVWGIDIDAQELRWAIESKAYVQSILGDITKERLPNDHFNTCVANCSLEHVPRLDLALKNILSSLKPGGTFLTFVPNRDWTHSLLSHRVLSRLGSKKMAEKLQHEIDTFFVHHHLYDRSGWRKVVEDAGFEVISVDPVLSAANTAAFELFLLPSLSGWVNKRLTTRWTNFPNLRKVMTLPTFALAKLALWMGDPTPTAEFLVVARRPFSA